MAQRRSLLFYLAVILVVISTLTQEAEARRKILRGRRVMTRTYYPVRGYEGTRWIWGHDHDVHLNLTKDQRGYYEARMAPSRSLEYDLSREREGWHNTNFDIQSGNAIPAWAISLIAGIGMLMIGGILYVVMRKFVLSSESGTLNTYQPALQNEEV